MATHTQRWPAGTPCWAEIMVGDLERSKEFYRAVLGWEFEDSGPEYGNYVNALVAGRRVAGISPPLEGEDEWPHVWTTYFATDEIAATASAVRAAGAEPLLEPMEIGEFGRIGMWVDPGGAAFGAWEAAQHNGFGVSDEHGAVTWVDLMTPDVAAAKVFYGSVFGFGFEDLGAEGLTYAMFTPPGITWAVGGIGDVVPDDALGPRWCVTFGVGDADEARQRVLDAGGEAPDEPVDSGEGRLVTVKGPDGEEFSLLAAPNLEQPWGPTSWLTEG